MSHEDTYKADGQHDLLADDRHIDSINIGLNNFSLIPPEEVMADDDVFPLVEYQLPTSYKDEIAGYKLHVFDVTGVRVYWGDLSIEQIENLKGTYYALHETDYKHLNMETQVLQMAIPRQDGLGHKRFNLKYIRTASQFAIVRGKKIRNNSADQLRA
jgi:hypothetical protein